MAIQASKHSAELEKRFLAAYEAHADEIFRHAIVRVRDRDAALDIMQEAFTRTWDYLAKGKEIEHIRAFLYRVSNNIIVDRSRRKKSSSLDALMDDEGFEPKDESTKDFSLSQEIREALALLDSLDEIYRTAISMRYLEELSPREIGEALGVSENVVSVRIHRGMERLHKLLADKEAGKGNAE